MAGLPKLERVCSCSGKLPRSFTKRLCVCRTGIATCFALLSLVCFLQSSNLSIILILSIIKGPLLTAIFPSFRVSSASRILVDGCWKLKHVVFWDLVHESCDSTLTLLCLQAEAAFDAGDYSRAASFYAKVNHQAIILYL